MLLNMVVDQNIFKKKPVKNFTGHDSCGAAGITYITILHF